MRPMTAAGKPTSCTYRFTVFTRWPRSPSARRRPTHSPTLTWSRSKPSRDDDSRSRRTPTVRRGRKERRRAKVPYIVAVSAPPTGQPGSKTLTHGYRWRCHASCPINRKARSRGSDLGDHTRYWVGGQILTNTLAPLHKAGAAAEPASLGGLGVHAEMGTVMVNVSDRGCNS